MSVYEKLMKVQSELKVHKSQINTFGHYNYRNCEDILEAVKPLTRQVGAVITLTDNIELIGARTYVKATAKFIEIEKGECVVVSAYAREDENKKGMDLSQLTGSTSSYARKYALNGLFGIDDTKDSDTTNNGKDDKKGPVVEIDTISKTQQKRLFELAPGNNQAVKEVLLKHKYTSSDKIKKVEYEAICQEIKKAVE